MALTDESNGGGMVMPVSPMGNGNGGLFGGDGSLLILFLIIAMFCGGWGNGGFGGGFDGGLYPWLNNSNQINSGFRDQMLNTAVSGIADRVTSGFGDVQLGLAGINQNLCQTGNGITAAVNNGFAQAEIANNARQMAEMQQAFNAQTATMQGFNGVQSQIAQCCCDNRLATANLGAMVQSENCADRAALSDGIRDIIANQTAGTQRILDMMCQDKIDSKNEKIAELQAQINMQNLAASQAAQTAAIIADNTAQTQYLVNRVAPYPIPSYTVANPYNSGCGYGFAA